MTERHLIAYLLILLMLVGTSFGVFRWRLAVQARRHGRRFGHR